MALYIEMALQKTSVVHKMTFLSEHEQIVKSMLKNLEDNVYQKFHLKF